MAKQNAVETPTKFGVFLREGGSYTAGEHRFSAEAPTPVPAEAAEAIDPEAASVKFYDTAEAAQAAHNKVREEWREKRRPRN